MLERTADPLASDGNLVFSPASIVKALAMTYAGASGATAQEMAETLHFQLQNDALHPAFNSLDSLLGVLVRIANSLCAQRDIRFERPFLDTLAADYGAGVRLVDYEAAAATAVVMRLTGAFEPVELTVDRPLLFALRDRDTGALMFFGRVSDPTV